MGYQPMIFFFSYKNMGWQPMLRKKLKALSAVILYSRHRPSN